MSFIIIIQSLILVVAVVLIVGRRRKMSHPGTLIGSFVILFLGLFILLPITFTTVYLDIPIYSSGVNVISIGGLFFLLLVFGIIRTVSKGPQMTFHSRMHRQKPCYDNKNKTLMKDDCCEDSTTFDSETHNQNLQTLYDSGLITKKEYQKKKRR